MTKPDDIPQDIWDDAVATEDAAHVAYGASLNDPYQSIDDASAAGIEVIARAIMAERERNAVVLQTVYDLLHSDTSDGGAASYLPAGGLECEELVDKALDILRANGALRK